MERTLILARHAATGNAARHIISGTLNEPLSAEGRAQAREYVDAHGPIQADGTLSSPLSRALDTASILTGRPLDEIDTWDSLIERDYGRLQGVPPEELAGLRAGVRYVHAAGIDHSIDPPDGETLDALRARAERVAADLLARNEQRILVVSHQTVMQQLTGVLLGLSLLEALAIDIRVLQIDEFTWSAGRPVERRTIHGGVVALTSW